MSKAILDLIISLLGGGTTAALVLATKVIEAIAKLSSSDPFVTLYESRVVEQNVVQFGASLGTGQDTGFLINVVECVVELKTEHKEVLFFKWDASDAGVNGRRYDLSLADDVYASVASLIHDKVVPYAQTYISAMEL